MSFYLHAHKTANAVSVFCFLLLLSGGLDLLLPERKAVEAVERIEEEIFKTSSRYSRSNNEQADAFLVYTRHNTLVVDKAQQFAFHRGDTVQISLSPLYGMVSEIHLLRGQQKHLFKRKASLLGNFSFLPWALLFTSGMGLLFYQDQRQAINFASGSLVLLVIMLWMVFRL